MKNSKTLAVALLGGMMWGGVSTIVHADPMGCAEGYTCVQSKGKYAELLKDKTMTDANREERSLYCIKDTAGCKSGYISTTKCNSYFTRNIPPYQKCDFFGKRTN